MNPKVFVSHANEDKERFALHFATILRSKGIDVWLDKWEMLPGDSLVDKIFEEGIKNADAFIIILSNNSVNKPWIKEELNAGLVKRINHKTKIIPVIIDDCEVPECLQSTLWEKITDFNNLNCNIDRIAHSIFGISEKPPLGEAPKHVKTILDLIPDLTKIDTIILNLSCEAAISKGDKRISLTEIYRQLKEYEIPDDEINESLEILDSKGYINGEKVLTGHIPFFSITQNAFESYVRKKFSTYDSIVEEICLKILNEELRINYLISAAIDKPIALINHILEKLETKGLVKLLKTLDGKFEVYSVSPGLKRMFK